MKFCLQSNKNLFSFLMINEIKRDFSTGDPIQGLSNRLTIGSFELERNWCSNCSAILIASCIVDEFIQTRKCLIVEIKH
jgi:hypothetical protein